MAQPLYTNKLINEKSPYLLQHAHNPVDWFPWGEEAFQAAKIQDKPIFLSIGYATCHWCHVMEEESFENLEIAELMNNTFISIKVDREEMPEVDSLYMEFAQAMMSGGAGWPLNVILTPDLMPFFAATYLPADASRGFLGMKQLILRIQQIWKEPEERETVLVQAGKIVEVFAANIHAEGREMPSKEHIHAAADLLFKTADPIYGGTKGAPKFPVGFQATFLLRLARSTSDSRALFYVERTLEMMYRGGIYDHLGGGFSRYSIDERWMIPHFEKMIYDNAILSRTYLETWQYTKQPFYSEIAKEILDFIVRDMKSPEGAFYSAQDADSDGHEGRYYTWTWDEIHKILGPDAALFCEYYGATPGGNFEGRNILHISYPIEEYARIRHLDPVLIVSHMKEMRQKLLDARNERPPLQVDDKIITAWNGLAIYALAEAGRTLLNENYVDAAEDAAKFIRSHLWKDGGLLRRYRDSDARFDACLDDYACLIQGLLSLFENDRGAEWLEFAMTLANSLVTEFKAPHGAFYLTDGKDPNLILRRCEFYDGSEPSGNAVHAENLIRLYQMTGVDEYLHQAEDILRAAKHHIDLYPPGACYQLMALQRYLDHDAPTLIIALNDQDEHKDEIAKLIAGHFIPHKTVVWKRESDEELRDLVPISRDKTPINGQTTLYICHQKRCKEPLTDLSAMAEAIFKL